MRGTVQGTVQASTAEQTRPFTTNPTMPHENPPQLPQGNSSRFSTLAQSFSFHSSPESFISSRSHHVPPSQHGLTPSITAKLRVIRARILNRNVAVVSSHRLCRDILNFGNGGTHTSVSAAKQGEQIGPDTFKACPAYRELISDFFPPPNLLTDDFPDHSSRRAGWEEQMSSLDADLAPSLRRIIDEHIKTWWHGSVIDLYDTMKDLSWQILLGTFLQLSLSDPAFSLIRSLQETLLRGQFSVFPFSISSPFWSSARAKGLEARRQLQTLLGSHLGQRNSSCPLLRERRVSMNDIASHALLFTSSITAKALASLLTASLLNIFLYSSDVSLASRIRAEGAVNGEILLRSILLETERLSPPIVGIMRRVEKDVILASPDGQPAMLIPSGWDVWLYFVGAGRDPAIYEMADAFLPERFISEGEPATSLAFGSGPKACLGRHVVRHIVLAVSQAVLKSDIRLDGSIQAPGVRGWLGWDSSATAEAFALDLKQLPCQRPRAGIKISVYRGNEADPQSSPNDTSY